MKTPEQLQSMSEKAAEFLKNDFQYSDPCMHRPEDFFEYQPNASYRMHLAKREMEKRGFEIVQRTPSKSYRYYSVHIGNRPGVNLETISQEQDDNEFIAFWDALLTAIGESA